MAKYYPIMLDISGKKCIVVGGGKVAQRKVSSLLQFNGKVTVISPELTRALRVLAEENIIHWIQREYKSGDFRDCYLIYVATDNYRTNQDCLEEARMREILINVVDKPEMCDFIVPASIARGDLTITVSTGGKSPMLSRKLREDLELHFGEIYGEYVEGLGELRKIVLSEVEDSKLREKIFKTIVYSDLLEQFKSGQVQNIKAAMKDYYVQIAKGEKNGEESD